MKKFYPIFSFLFIISTFYGCTQNNLTTTDTDILKSEHKDYDIIFSIPKYDNVENLLKFCDDYENEKGVKVQIREYGTKKSSLDELTNMLTSKEYPSIYCTTRPEDTMSVEKLGLTLNLSKTNNSVLQTKLNETSSNAKIPNNKTECYGISLKKYYENENSPQEYILSVNEKAKEVEKKLSIDFLIYILENKIL